MSRAKFRVVGTFDMASAAQVATVTIDREISTFSVRPLHRKKTYTLPLAYVAAMVTRAIIQAELREKRAAKAAAKKARKEAARTRRRKS